MLRHYSINDRGANLIERELRPNQRELQIHFYTHQNGATVIDMGVKEKAGFLAAKYLTEISLGGFGRLRFTKAKIGGRYFPAVAVYTDYPMLAELAGHCAFWRVAHCGAVKNLSGPVRSRPAALDDYSRATGYVDTASEKAIAVYQIDYLPSEAFVARLAAAAGVRPENFYLMVARTGTMTGAVHIAARNVEQTMPTLLDKGFPVDKVVYAMGMAPIVAVNDDELEAYGRVNDALIYGQETNLAVDCGDGEIERVLDNLTMDQAGNTDVYGTCFKEIFASCGNNWVNLPREWDAPSKINFYNLRTGRAFTTGKHGTDVLLRGFMGENGGIVR